MDKKTLHRKGIPILPFFIFIISAILVATVYSVFAILGRVPVSWPIFFAWLGVLNLFNGLFLYSLWKSRGKLGIGARTLAILWGGISVWYWSFGPLYYFFNMQPDTLQLAWVMFAYFWEVPVVGGGLFVLGGYFLLRKTRNYYLGKYNPENPEKLYKQILRYPIYIGIWLFLVVVIGYIIGTIQLSYFAFLPSEEAPHLLKLRFYFLTLPYWLLFFF